MLNHFCKKAWNIHDWAAHETGHNALQLQICKITLYWRNVYKYKLIQYQQFQFTQYVKLMVWTTFNLVVTIKYTSFPKLTTLNLTIEVQKRLGPITLKIKQLEGEKNYPCQCPIWDCWDLRTRLWMNSITLWDHKDGYHRVVIKLV